jgi:hypothetical protein
MEEQPKKHDFWEKVSLILHSSGGLLAAVTVAVISLIGSSYLKERDLEEGKRTQATQLRQSQNTLYTELLTKREEAESALRKDMFNSIIQSFLSSKSTGLDERVLNLELLAYNFHESLNLKPLFMYLERQINASKDTDKQAYMDRLFKVAGEISRKQLLVLENAGAKSDMIIDLGEIKNNPGGFALEDPTLTVNGISRQFSLFVSAVDEKARQIKFRMDIKTPNITTGTVDTSTAEFWVGYFDFPMIDNTRLPEDQRAAIVLNTFEDGFADITVALFPGSYASLKDKASIQEIIENITKTDKDSSL